ncbi:MAG: hypothetical protein LJE70_04335 [Chromatiaceae bacterium]|nr:hypothetical protein [Chromatiaceae bacterium]
MTEHLIGAGESLAAVADIYELSGWQGLYYADVNRGFRQCHPDPWELRSGVAIAIPGSIEEQQYALSARYRLLEALQRDVLELAAEQEAFLAGRAADEALLLSPQEMFSDLARLLAATTLRAIRLLKASERGCSRTDWALAEDALQRWPLTARHECATLFSLVARSAQSVPWVIPTVAARGWCDVVSPSFWAKPLLAVADGSELAAPELKRLLSIVRGARQVALANVMQQLASLHTGALMELNRLARLQENEQD